MEKLMILLALASIVVNVVHADVYMHNPRGSNDRNCERNVNRDNGNRLFNRLAKVLLRNVRSAADWIFRSQNNNKGGYACPRAVGDETMQNEAGNATLQTTDAESGTTSTFYQSKRMYYYSGSVLPIEWTSQHGCGGNSKVNCEIVLQYACEDTLDPK